MLVLLFGAFLKKEKKKLQMQKANVKLKTDSLTPTSVQKHVSHVLW